MSLFPQFKDDLFAIFCCAAYGVGTETLKWLRDVIKRRRTKPQPLAVISHRDIEVSKLLRQIRLEMNADRCFVAMFDKRNNGDIPRYSWVYEDTAANIAYIQDRYQDVLASLTPLEIKIVEEDGPSFRERDRLEDGFTRRMLFETGVVALARCKITRSERIIGFVGLDFCREVKEPPAYIEKLVQYAGRLELLLPHEQESK